GAAEKRGGVRHPPVADVSVPAVHRPPAGGGAGGGYEPVRPAFGGNLPPGDRSAAPDPVPVCPADADCPPPVDGLRRTVPVPEIYLPLRGRCGDSGGALLSGGFPH